MPNEMRQKQSRRLSDIRIQKNILLTLNTEVLVDDRKANNNIMEKRFK